jgi:hypothetical protein
MGKQPVWAIGEEKNLFLPCRNSNSESCSTEPSHYTGYAIPASWIHPKIFNFFRPILHPTAPPDLHARTACTARQSIKTWDKCPSIRDLCTGSGRKVSLPLQLVFPSCPLIKMVVRDLEMF